jgi:hypothetical protein
MPNGDYKTTNTVLKWIAGIISALVVAVVSITVQNAHEANKKTQEQLNGHESRIVKMETCLEYVAGDISEIKEMTKEIRQDQKRRERIGK